MVRCRRRRLSGRSTDQPGLRRLVEPFGHPAQDLLAPTARAATDRSRGRPAPAHTGRRLPGAHLHQVPARPADRPRHRERRDGEPARRGRPDARRRPPGRPHLRSGHARLHPPPGRRGHRWAARRRRRAARKPAPALPADRLGTARRPRGPRRALRLPGARLLLRCGPAGPARGRAVRARRRHWPLLQAVPRRFRRLDRPGRHHLGDHRGGHPRLSGDRWNRRRRHRHHGRDRHRRDYRRGHQQHRRHHRRGGTRPADRPAHPDHLRRHAGPRRTTVHGRARARPGSAGPGFYDEREVWRDDNA